tara:strand:+ start:447 stop:560 length:114 start_codon:yes stop_codon:yes gene_type:complete
MTAQREAKKPMGNPTFIKGHIRKTRWDEKKFTSKEKG